MLKDGERIDDLEYNNLRIIQKKDGYCFTSDSVLLANLTPVKHTDRVVDLCTGSGVIAILIAGKFQPKEVVGVEIQDRLAEMATRSVELNSLSNVKIVCAAAQGVEKIIGDNYDVVVANPPYENNFCEDLSEKSICKNEIKLTLEELVTSASKLLKFGGTFVMVHRARRLADAICAMRDNKIEPKRLTLVYPKADRKADTFIIEGKKGAKSSIIVPEPLIVYDEDGEMNAKCRRLYNK